MARIPVKRDERVVRFFGKRRRLDDNGEFKAGRLRVLVLPETARGFLWHADLSGYNDAVTIAVGGARSRAAALKQLERRIELLQRALDTFCREAW